MSSNLGFGKTNKLDLSGFAPRPAEKTDIMKEQEAADRAAAPPASKAGNRSNV